MNDTFLRACMGEKVSYTPLWFMRQAGRYLPEYQDIRSEVDFLTLCKTPELAAKVTVQPVDILGVDAAILFSDILILSEAMGMRLEFSEKEGPKLSEPIRSRSLAEKLTIPYPEDDFPFILETIRLLRERLDVPLIGFSGAPLTLATYMIEGESSKNFIHTKKMMFSQEGLFDYLMDKITDSVIVYLASQIRAGAQAIQLFDTWAGMLSPDDYRVFALPYVKKITSTLKKEHAPIIYFVNGSAGILKDIKSSGADVIGLDWRVDIGEAIKKLGRKVSIQGNLEPAAVFLPENKLIEKVKDILSKASSARGHIFNLGHGILPETPVESAKALVRLVHELSREVKEGA